MNDAVAILINGSLAAILAVSGVLKLTAANEFRDALTRLRLPVALPVGVVARTWPWIEIVLALAIMVLPGPYAVGVSALVLATLVGFLMVTIRAYRRGDRIACACFGSLSRAPLGRATIVRNAGLVLLGALGVVAAVHGSMLGLITHLAPADRGVLQLGVLMIAALVVLRLADRLAGGGARAGRTGRSGDDQVTDDQDADGHRGSTERHSPALPALLLTDLFGAEHDVRRFVGDERTVLIFLSTACASCRALADDLPGWRAALAAQGVGLRAVTSVPASRALGAFPVLGAFLHHDPDDALALSLGVTSWPAAVYVGGDGTPTVSQGPVVGAYAIGALVANLRATEALVS